MFSKIIRKSLNWNLSVAVNRPPSLNTSTTNQAIQCHANPRLTCTFGGGARRCYSPIQYDLLYYYMSYEIFDLIYLLDFFISAIFLEKYIDLFRYNFLQTKVSWKYLAELTRKILSENSSQPSTNRKVKQYK